MGLRTAYAKDAMGSSTLKPRARLFVRSAIAAGTVIRLEPDQAHRLRSVRRLSKDDPVTVFDGRNGEWLATIVAMAKNAVEVRPTQQVRHQAVCRDLWLIFAPIKKTRIDFIVEKATELGVTRLQPVVTHHTDVARVNIDRLQLTAIEAAEQCERLDIPDVVPPVRLPGLIADWAADRPLLVCAEAGAARPFGDVAAELAGLPAAILVGPEGGFSKAELDALGNLPSCRAVGLGPRILRTETAALTALACWQGLAGDHRDRPHGRSAPPLDPSD